MANAPVYPAPITFVCCVESGALENQTIRMVESLRRWGGSLANAPIFAVTPRFGPPLAAKTQRMFKLLHVHHIRYWGRDQYSWNKYLNKPYALAVVEQRATTECIAWLDSDLLIVDEPKKLLLQDGEDFLACATDKNIASTGSDSPFEPYWQVICQAVGLRAEDLPWITTETEGAKIRLYWNSGLFVYRKATNFSKIYLETCLQLFDSNIACWESGFFFNDQVALGLAMIKADLLWRALPHSYNYTMGSKSHQYYQEQHLKKACIIHYHDAMWPHFWQEFLRCIDATHPEVGQWLASIGPMKNEAPLQWRTMGKVLAAYRKRREIAYDKACKRF